MEIGQRCNVSVTKDLEIMADLFGEMVRKKAPLRSECVDGMFEKLVIEFERHTEKLMSSTTKLEEHEANLFRKTDLLCSVSINDTHQSPSSRK